jgi:hypothetical protein
LEQFCLATSEAIPQTFSKNDSINGPESQKSPPLSAIHVKWYSKNIPMGPSRISDHSNAKKQPIAEQFVCEISISVRSTTHILVHPSDDSWLPDGAQIS